MNTLFLLPETWDLALDTNGNIAIASDIYQQAQDISSACKTFTGDVYYDQALGIPYFQSILGVSGYPLALYKLHLQDAALSMPNIASATPVLNGSGRTITGAILFTNDQDQQGRIEL